VATSHDDYVGRAVALAQDVAALERTRGALRDTMRHSPFLDHAAFARHMEAAFRDMWQRWCATQSAAMPLSLEDAIVHHRAGRLQEAEAAYAALPDSPDALHLLGVIASQQGDNAVAVQRITGAIVINPGQAAYHCNLGAAYQALHRHDEAIASYRQALTLQPDYALALNNLGNVLNDSGRPEEAIASFGRALAVQPDYADAHSNLGSLFKRLGRNLDAVASLRKAIELNPALAQAHFNLGNALSSIGQLDDALACFENALQIDPDFADAHGNLVFGANYHPTLSAEAIFALYQRWNERLAAPLADCLPPPPNRPDPAARLKIAYVSGDFRNHSVIHFAAPLIENHDRSRVEISCYHNSYVTDDQSRRIMAAVDHWIPCRAMSDAELADRIRADGIDVL
ncbi:tetratricopeptide repeat protein, partial [Massilia eurypsychrophila]